MNKFVIDYISVYRVPHLTYFGIFVGIPPIHFQNCLFYSVII